MPHRFGSLRFVDAAPAIHQLELGYELPGMNKLTANVRGTTDGVSLRVRHAEDEPGVTAIHLQDKTGKEVELLYPISSHTGERLVVELADAEQTYYRQFFNSTVNPSVSAVKVHRSLELLSRKALESEEDGFRAALEKAF